MNAPVPAPEISVLLNHPDNDEPNVLTQDELRWLPALAPLAIDELTDRHYEALTEKRPAQSPYFQLLARVPEALDARTRIDKDIFYNRDDGLP